MDKSSMEEHGKLHGETLLNTLDPIHIALIKGNLEAFKLIFASIECKNPVYNQFGDTLFHRAASLRLIDHCKLIIENTHIKNPSNSRGTTPLHLSARPDYLDFFSDFTSGFPLHVSIMNGGPMNGHLAICELIIKNIDNKNPTDNNGKTPLHMAAQCGFLDICKLIMKNVEDKNPADYSGETPLHLAASNDRG